MPLTRSFKDTVKARAARDPAFRDALLTEAVESVLAGELDAGKAVLCDDILRPSASNARVRKPAPPRRA